MSLERLQRGLQDIYEIEVGHDVRDFLVTDETLAAALGADTGGGRERLLLRQDADGIDLSLYLGTEVVAALEAGGIADLDKFCQALEGVSHFLYLVWHAERARSVSRLEMELQAEVDKYVLIRELVAVAGPAGGLLERLFWNVNFAPQLGAAELRRYRAANDGALRYCLRLEAEFNRPGQRGARLRELRRFYRLPERGKLRAAAGY